MSEEIRPPRAWWVDVVDGLSRLVVFAAVGVFYDFNRLVPGPIILLVAGAYLTPPVVRAVKQHKKEQNWQANERARIEMLQRQLAETTEGQLLQRLAALVDEGRPKTGVIEAVAIVAAREQAALERKVGDDG